MEICLVTGLEQDIQTKIEIAGWLKPMFINRHKLCLGTFSSRHVYPQSGECAETRVTRDGVFRALVEDGCSDTVALIARRYDLDSDTL